MPSGLSGVVNYIVRVIAAGQEKQVGIDKQFAHPAQPAVDLDRSRRCNCSHHFLFFRSSGTAKGPCRQG